MLRAADVGVNVGRLGPVRPAPRRSPGCDGTGPGLGPGLSGRPGAQRYSFFRIHTRTNHPQMGGR